MDNQVENKEFLKKKKELMEIFEDKYEYMHSRYMEEFFELVNNLCSLADTSYIETADFANLSHALMTFSWREMECSRNGDKEGSENIAFIKDFFMQNIEILKRYENFITYPLDLYISAVAYVDNNLGISIKVFLEHSMLKTKKDIEECPPTDAVYLNTLASRLGN